MQKFLNFAKTFLKDNLFFFKLILFKNKKYYYKLLSSCVLCVSKMAECYN